MMTLPLFPLNTVLFPGIPVYLHIFEARYKQMIEQCIAEERSFGVVLIREGVEVGGSAEPYAVGCTAQIIRSQRLEEGRLNIVALGQRRFRVAHLNYDQPYLVGEVEIAPVCSHESAEQLINAEHRLMPWIERYVGALRQFREVRYFPDELPDDPLMLAYAAAHILQIPPNKKQALLEIDAALTLLEHVRYCYRCEIAYLKSAVNHAQKARNVETDTLFSLN